MWGLWDFFMVFRIVYNLVFCHFNSYLMTLSTGWNFGKIANMINVMQIMRLPPCQFWAPRVPWAVDNSALSELRPYFYLTIAHGRRLRLWMDMLQSLKMPIEQGKPGKTGELSTYPHVEQSTWTVYNCGKSGCTWAIRIVKPQPKYTLGWGLCISFGWFGRG